MNMTVIAVGRLREKPYRMMADEYLKRLGAYAKVEVREVADRDPAKCGGEETAREREGSDVLKVLEGCYRVVLLDIGGRELSSEELASKMAEISFTSSTIDFVIGGSLGLSKEVKSRAALRLSFGRITLPHQLARVVLLEQIYRAFKINAGEVYHK